MHDNNVAKSGLLKSVETFLCTIFGVYKDVKKFSLFEEYQQYQA